MKSFKNCLYPVYFFWKFKFTKVYNNLFNKVVRDQNRDYRKIPIFIISFNQLYYLKELVKFLQKGNYEKIIVVDNNSDYPPLKEYLRSKESELIIFYLDYNYGHTVFDFNKDIFRDYIKGYYAISDPDIVPLDICPTNFLLEFKRVLDKNFNVRKVGFSLKIDDLPEENPQKQNIIRRQQKFWTLQDDEGNYYGNIDTIFGLHRPNNFNFKPLGFYSGIRMRPPYIARHGGWYINPKNLTEEQVYYFRTSNNSASWKINSKGNLENKKFPGE